MSNQFLKLRRSAVPGKIPTTSSLEFGEIALNTYDGLAFIKKSGSNGEEIVVIGATSGSFSGSLYGTASWSEQSLTSSYSLNINGEQYYVAVFDGNNSITSSTIYQSGSYTSLRYETTPEDPNNPEILYVPGYGVETYNLISAHTDYDSYAQINVQNFSAGTTSSADIVATNNIGDENSYYINMGINSDGYNVVDGIGNQNDAYLYSTGEDLLIGNAAEGKRVIIFNGTGSAINVARVFIVPEGTVGINATDTNPSNPESLLVEPIAGASNPSQFGNLIIGKGTIHESYLQSNITNLGTGSAASADVVATNDIGTETDYFIDMGINSSNYSTPNAVGMANDAYLYSTGEHLHIGNASANMPVMFFAGGLDSEANRKLELWPDNHHYMTGSLDASEGFTGSLHGTASWALNSLTASFVQNAVSASYAATASSADNFVVRGDLTGSNAVFTGTITAQRLNVQYITASTEFITGSTKFGTQLTDTHQFTGSVSVTGSLSVNGGLVPLGSGTAGQVTVWSGSNQLSGSNNLFWDASNSRLGIGISTPTDTLTVTGSTLLRGATTSSANNALTVQNGDGTNLLSIRNDNLITYSTGLTLSQVGTRVTFSSLGGANVNQLRFTTTNTLTSTTGNTIFLDYVATFNPTSGTSTFAALQYTGTINQTGGANGITRGLYVNPTLTSAADWRSIEWSNNTGWGLYGSGSAPNYVAGNISIATTNTPRRLNLQVALGSEAAALGIYDSSGLASIIGLEDVTRDFQLASVTGIRFYSNSTLGNIATEPTNERARITNNGNFLIGTTIDSGFRLDVSGSARINNLTGSLFGTASWALNAVTASFVPSTAVVGDFSRIATGSVTASVGVGTASFQLTSGSSTFLFVSSSGNVGIGTNLPQHGLDIRAVATDRDVLRIQSTSPSGFSSIGFFDNSNNQAGGFGYGNPTSVAPLANRVYFYSINKDLIFLTNGGSNERLRIHQSSGNISINSTTDAGYKLLVSGSGTSGSLNVDNTLYVSGSRVGIGTAGSISNTLEVSGSTLLRGSGNTLLTNALTVQNSDATNLFRVANDSRILYGSRPITIFPTNDGINAGSNGRGILFSFAIGAISLPIFRINTGALTATSGVISTVDITSSFEPTSGNANWTGYQTNVIINQTGGANGITRGLYVTPTLTSAADWRSIEWSNNTGWGLYGAGGAANYLSGSLSIGTLTTGSFRLDVSGSARISDQLYIESASVDYQQNLSLQTGSWQTIVASPTGSYRAAFFDYAMFSGSIGRAGTVTTFWSASATEFYENYTEDLGGSTAGVVLQTAISASQIVLQATASSAAWTIRSLVRLL